jgi:CBS domain-containing protein
MSQRAAWQLERYGFTHVHDFVHGKAYWLASGRATVRDQPIDRVLGHLNTDVATIDAAANVAQALKAGIGGGRVVVIGARNVVLGTLRAEDPHDVDPNATAADIMRFGPATIRPDELTDAVRQRMSSRNVTSLIVTAPTGVLLGTFDAP